MKKNTNKPAGNVNTHTAPEANQDQPQAGSDNAAESGNEEGDKPSNVSPIKSVKKAGLFSTATRQVTQEAAEKIVLMGDVRQKLAEASDVYSAAGEQSEEAQAIASKAGAMLYQARAKGIISKEEVSSVLGDSFGFKKRKDPNNANNLIEGKTPDGQGEVIRKRVARAAEAAEYVSVSHDGVAGGEGVSRFFDGLPVEEVSEIVDRLDIGDITIWQAYSLFAEVKKNATDRLEAAFNPKAIAKIVDKLSEEGAVNVIRSNPDLIAAYGALYELLGLLDAEGAEPAAVAA